MQVLDRERFEAFYRARSAWLIGALHPIVGNDAEDVAQDAFLTLFERWDVVSAYDAPEAWLRRVAIRAAIRRRQREASRPRHETLAGMPPTLGSDDPASALLQDALKHLTAHEREVLILRYFWERPIQELAERFECTEAAMRVRLHRACRRAEEHVLGLYGTWVMNMTWTPDTLAPVIEDGGYRCWVEPVLENLLELAEVRTELQLTDGRFLLTNGSVEHLDHGRYTLTKGRLRLESSGFRGGVVYHLGLDGESLALRQLENHNPVIHGAPDDAFQLALVGSSPFTWRPAAV